MPYYTWRGVTMHATYCKGRLYAHSIAELEKILLHREIALTRATEYRFSIAFIITRMQVVTFLKQITVLLRSGILLPQALHIIAEQTDHARMQRIVRFLHEQVSQGVSLSIALEKYPRIFSPVIVHLIRIGEKSGCLVEALDALLEYLEMAVNFGKKITHMMVMPLITFFAFIGISFVLLIGVVPRFVQLFNSMGRDVPSITQWLIYISTVLQKPLLWVCALGLLIGTFGVYILFQKSIKRLIDRLLLCIAGIRTLIIDISLLYWFHALSLLLHKKVPLVAALNIANPLVVNYWLQKDLRAIAEHVAFGHTLRFSMVNTIHQPFKGDILALMHIGQESGELEGVVEKAAYMYRQKVDRMLHMCTFVIQPLLLILLGLLIAFLVFALYMPIFNVAYIV